MTSSICNCLRQTPTLNTIILRVGASTYEWWVGGEDKHLVHNNWLVHYLIFLVAQRLASHSEHISFGISYFILVWSFLKMNYYSALL